MQLLYQTPTPDLSRSKKYFSDLNFEWHKVGDTHLACDNQVTLLISDDRKIRPGICMIKKSWTEELDALRVFAKVHSKDNNYFLADPSGCWIQLKEEDSIPVPRSQKKCLLGNFAGLSLETMDIVLSARIFACLGFDHTMGAIDKGWGSYSDQHGNTISLMAPFACPHLFLNPSLTFFNGKANPKIIREVRDRAIPIMEELTVFNKEGIVDNIILNEPGGYGFFVFND